MVPSPCPLTQENTPGYFQVGSPSILHEPLCEASPAQGTVAVLVQGHRKSFPFLCSEHLRYTVPQSSASPHTFQTLQVMFLSFSSRDPFLHHFKAFL